MFNIGGIHFKVKRSPIKDQIARYCSRNGLNYKMNDSFCFFSTNYDNFTDQEIMSAIFSEQQMHIISDTEIFNRKELYTLILSGKNEKDLNFSDSALILELYKRFSYELVKYIDGEFSFVIWDEKKKDLFCCRSKTGKKLLYFYENEEIFVFSSQIMPFSNIFDLNLAINDQYVSDFF